MSVILPEKTRYILMSLDPVHIGTGGYRLGRVDNAIVREPGTNVPKIPGSSLHGAISHAAALAFGDPKSAGQKKEGKNTSDPVIYTFGYSNEHRSRAGVVQICDAQILFFPVASVSGPIWITTAGTLNDALNASQIMPPSNKTEVIASSKLKKKDEKLTLGWLQLTVKNTQDFTTNTLKLEAACTKILDRLVIVHEDLFSELVNANLEVRTSVAINPNTGTADEGALFTYEAIPRATFFWADYIVDDYPNSFPVQSEQIGNPSVDTKSNKNEDNPEQSPSQEWKRPKDVVNAGIALLEYLGVGGMVTRGFGRVKKIQEWPPKSTLEEANNDG